MYYLPYDCRTYSLMIDYYAPVNSTDSIIGYNKTSRILTRYPKPKDLVIYSGTTNASGNYTVTFPTAYSVPPNVNPSIPNQSIKSEIITITSVTTTGFTVNVSNRASVNVVGVEVLLAATVNVANRNVEILITPK